MERHQDLGVRVRVVRIDVDHERGEHERRGRQHPASSIELTPSGEVHSEERQHEQGHVPREPGRLVVREAGSEACELDHDSRGDREDQRLDPAAGSRRSILAGSEKLFPQPVAVLACELPRHGVQVAHPFHGDQERLVLREPGRVQLCDLVAKMVLQLVDVVAVDRRGVCDVRPPLGDLQLEAFHRHASPSAVRSAPEPGHASLSARVTVTHCRWCSASAARPTSVIT